MLFTHADKKYEITAEVVEKALGLPELGDKTFIATHTATLLDFIRNIVNFVSSGVRGEGVAEQKEEDVEIPSWLRRYQDLRQMDVMARDEHEYKKVELVDPRMMNFTLSNVLGGPTQKLV
ncbi:hypothetical protein AgCh_039156 [Apium graveolens]